MSGGWKSGVIDVGDLRGEVMGGRSSAGIEGENCKFLMYSVFDMKPVQGLQSRVGMISGAGTDDNFGESILNTLDPCYVVLGRRSIENGIRII